MNNKKLFKILKQLSIPAVYGFSKSETRLPRLIFIQDGGNNFAADNIVYKKDNNYRLELYTNQKDLKLEEEIENLLDNNEIYWSKSEDIYIDSESLHEVYYSI